MKKISILLILVFIHFEIQATTPFSQIEPFFDREAFENGQKKEEFKSKSCPDGSKFLALSFLEKDQKKISEATCFYPDKELAVVIEHVWVDGVKSQEYSTVKHKLHGKLIERKNDDLYFISEYCYGRILKTEVQLHDEVISIAIYGKDQENPESFLYLNEPSLNVNPQNVSNYKPCDNKFKFTNKQFLKWLNREWTDFSKLTGL